MPARQFGGSTSTPKPVAPVAPRGPGSAGYAAPWIPNTSGGMGAANPNFQEELSQSKYAAQQKNAADNAASSAASQAMAQAERDRHYALSDESRRRGYELDDEERRRANSKTDATELLAQLGPPPGAPGAGPAVPVAPPVPGAAEGAEFSRAKDRIGQLLGGGMKALKNQFASRGLAGSGLEAAGMTDLVEGSQGDLGDVIRDQAIEGERRGQQVEDRDYAGRQRMRDQDIDIWKSRQQMLLNLLAQRGGSLY